MISLEFEGNRLDYWRLKVGKYFLIFRKKIKGRCKILKVSDLIYVFSIVFIIEILLNLLEIKNCWMIKWIGIKVNGKNW